MENLDLFSVESNSKYVLLIAIYLTLSRNTTELQSKDNIIFHSPSYWGNMKDFRGWPDMYALEP